MEETPGEDTVEKEFKVGKRTTTRHKEDNTFRFQTFEQKLRQISVNVNLSIRDGRADDLGERDTYFSQELEKWVDLNRTETFADLLCKIGTDSRSLTQIVLQKDRIAKVLLEHLECSGNVGSFEPAFALSIALARDLGEEFYQHFSDFVKVIIKIVMESKSTNIIEAGFKCYAYLSKYLRRQIIKDIQHHMKVFSCFLNPKLKTYVLIFACESFSIVAGKYARDHPEKFLKFLFGVFLRKHPEHAVGVATLLFAIYKGVSGTLKLKGPGMHFKDCIVFLDTLESSEEVAIWSEVLSHLTLRLLNHANASNSDQLISLIEATIVENLSENRDITKLLGVYATMVEFNNAGKITNVENCSKVIQTVSSNKNINHCEFLCRIVAAIIESKHSSEFDTEILKLLQPVINDLLENPELTFEMLETLDKLLRGFRAYFRMFLEPITESYKRIELPPYVTECHNIAIYCLSEAILQQGGLFQLPNSADHYFSGVNSPMFYFQTQKRIISVLNASNIKGTIWDCCSLLDKVKSDMEGGIAQNQITYYTRLFLVFSRLNSRNCENCIKSCTRILEFLLNAEQPANIILPAVNYLLHAFIAQISVNASFYKELPVKKLLDYFTRAATGASCQESFNVWSLKVLDTVIYFMNEIGTENYMEYLKEFVAANWSFLADNLMSGFRMVRALTSSILRNTVKLFHATSEKTIEMLDKFLELEDMSLTNSKYSSLAKSILTECKVIVGSDNYDVDLKLLVLKYTLGLLYTNFNLIWSPCIETIRQAGKHIDMPKYWDVFGTHFCKNQRYLDKTASEHIRLSILPDEEDSTNFLDVLTLTTFGLTKLEAGYMGPQEQLDITQYKINLWLSLRGQPLTRNEFADIKLFVDAIIAGCTNLSTREQSKLVIPVLQFLESCDVVNVNHELWESALKYLTYGPDVQKAAWKFLFAKRKNKLKNYKEDIDHILNSDSMDPFHKFRVDAVDISLNKQYENETLERRSVLMDILIRILIGKERVMKGEKRTQVLRFLAGCSESDAQKYLSLTVGSPQEVQQLPPKIIEIKINKMTSALRTWRYKFPNILDQIVNSACDLVCAVSSSVKSTARRSLNPEDEIPDDVFEEQKKSALKAGRMCIVAFFNSLPRLNMKQETIDRIFEVFIWPALDDITSTSVGSVSWILKLFLVWSVYERYHVLLTKCKDNNVIKSPMWRLFDLLDSKSVVFEVKKYLLGIIFNLMNPPEIPEESDEPEESYLNCSNLPLDVTGAYKFERPESIGVNIVLLRKEVILNLFLDAQLFKKFTTHSGGGNCLSLISLLAGFTCEGETNEKLCSVIIDTFAMCRNNEENFVNSIEAVGKLLSNVKEPQNLLMKVAPNFSWITGRRLRTALVGTLCVIKESPLYEIIDGLNAWAETAEDTPNFSKRQEFFEKAEKFIKNDDFDLLSYTLIFYNAIYCISKEDDIGIRNSAKNLLILMANSLKNKASTNVQTTKNDVHKILDSVILPKLRSRIQEKVDKRYEDVLRVLYGFINSCNELHGTFKELTNLLPLDIIDGLCDIQVHLRTRAMNRLAKKVKEVSGNGVSPAVLQAYILPMATHHLFDEERLSKNFNELVDSSIEVLKAVMSATSHEQYFSYLNKLLDDTKKKTKLAKQFERVLIAIMDAFHFDLSLACPEERQKDGEPTSSKPLNLEIQNEKSEATIQSDASEDEALNNEEFNIPKESVQQTITLVPQTAAVRCLGILKSSIIPKLRKFLNFEETATHKMSRSSKTVDNDVILKIPCTIALVKLLKKIPKTEGQNGIRSIIPSITAGLRNELVSIRNTLRKTLLSVIQELGTSHLKVVVGYLKSSLQRGYQKHVLNYTVAYLLRCLENELRAQPDHVPVKEIISLCEDELYGVMQEEKELAAIKQKTREASKSNACPILKVSAKCVSNVEQLNSLIHPAVKHLTEKKSLKVAKASRQWLSSVGEGLAENKAVNCYELLQWLFEVLNKDGSREDEALKGDEEANQPLQKKRKLLETPVDSKIIPTLKRKTVSEGKVGGQSLLTEFSFTCLYTGLNRNGRFRERLENNDALLVLDQFVSSLTEGIKSPSKQVNVVALRCITLLLEFKLPSLKKSEIIDKLQRNGFIAMNNHCYRNTTDSEITNATFKFLSAFFIRFSDFKIVLQDFELMLKCIQGYLTDGNCSSSALTLLKGVLQNKYKCSALPDLMQEVFKQCITSYYQHINEGCRQVYITYLNNYLTDPKELYLEVQLILRQLDYEHEGGRLTATEILNSLLQNIPQDCFEEIKELIFLKVLATLDKEKFPKVRERLGEAMKLLFKLEKGKSLVKILLKLLLLDKHIPELDTFFLIVGLVIDDPKVFSNEDISVIIGRIKDVLEPTSLAKMCSDNTRITIQIKDYMVFQAVVAFKKVLSRNVFDVPLWSVDSPLADEIREIFDLLREVYLLYEHEWVPLIAVDIISIVLNKLQLTDEDTKTLTAKNIESQKSLCVFLPNENSLQQLLGKLWVAMKRSEREDLLAKGAFVLVILIAVAARFKDKSIFTDIVDRIRKSVNGEVVKNPRVTTVRSVALGCFRGIAKTCPRDAIEHVVEIMTRVAVRELTDDNVPQDIKNECEKLISVLRDAIGNSAFNVIHAKVNDFLHKKRNLNRAKKKETAVLHPGLVRKRPKKVNVPYKGNKKRKTR